MGSRRKSRESALKILYQADISGGGDVERLVEEYYTAPPDDVDHPTAADDRAFVTSLVNGVTGNKETIDAFLDRALSNWPLKRLGYLERAILRMGVFEIVHQDTTPDKVAVNEAIELAKTYCEPASARLINGALDHVMNEHRKHDVTHNDGDDASRCMERD